MTPKQEIIKKQIYLLICMYLGYAGFMLLKTAVIVAGPALMEDPSLDLSLTQWGAIMGYGTLGGITGKFISGWAADKFGGRITFIAGLLITTLGVGIFGMNSSSIAFTMIFFVVLLAKSSGWPSMAKLIGNWYSPDQYGRVWGVLSTSSRAGTITATLAVGSLLRYMDWRKMLWCTSAIGLLLVGLCLYFLREHPPKLLEEKEKDKSKDNTKDNHAQENTEDQYINHHLFKTTLPQALMVFAKSKRFWLITGSMMGLTIMWDFLNFVPIYLKDSLHLSAADAASATASFPIGSFISVLLGGYLFDKLSKSAVKTTVNISMAISVLSVGVLMYLPELGYSDQQNLYITLVALFVFGFTVAPAYYLPMSIFSISYGGPHSGFLIALLDAFGFAASMTFSFIGGAVADKPGGWSQFLILFIAISVFSWWVTVWFLKGEAELPAES